MVGEAQQEPNGDAREWVGEVLATEPQVFGTASAGMGRGSIGSNRGRSELVIMGEEGQNLINTQIYWHKK